MKFSAHVCDEYQECVDVHDLSQYVNAHVNVLQKKERAVHPDSLLLSWIKDGWNLKRSGIS